DHLTVGLALEPEASPTATSATVSVTVSPTETFADPGVTIKGPTSVGARVRQPTSAADSPAATSKAEAEISDRFATGVASSIRVVTWPLAVTLPLSEGGNEAKRRAARCDKSCRAV